ncbi:MAG: hypothetical protein QOH66_2018, partial [Actinomycetota bacterium]|nr:hypothetical protein [Actinomycetota bacterium]
EALEHPDGIVRAQYRDRRPDADAGRACGDRAEHHVGGRQGEVVRVVFTDPEEVHAHLVGEHALFDDVADRLGVRCVPKARWFRRRRSTGHRACCASDGGRSSGFAVQAESPNRPQAAAVKSRGGERWGKRPATSGSGERREDEHVQTTADASKQTMTASKPGWCANPGTKAHRAVRPQSGGFPACRPGGARCIGGVSSSQALAWNGRTCRLRTVIRSKWASNAPRVREGDPQAADTARGRVPGGAGADRPVVARKAP